MNNDVLSDILTTLRVHGSVYFCDQLNAPWDKEFCDPDVASFHQIRRGGCWLQTPGGKEYLGPGDLMFAGPGVRHTLSSGLNQGDGGPATPTLLLCGYVQFSLANDSVLRRLFPESSVLRQNDLEQNLWLRATLDRLAAEYLSAQPGASVIVRRLTEVLIVELIRDNFGRGDDLGFVQALAHKSVGRALQALHLHPAKPWTLDSLATHVGMSRASLARKFKTLIGQPMFEYLTQLRMQTAKELLEDASLSLHDVAAQAGYESAVAFAKTFKKQVGLTPTAYRQKNQK